MQQSLLQNLTVSLLQPHGSTVLEEAWPSLPVAQLVQKYRSFYKI
jgi:hypothetical protein